MVAAIAHRRPWLNRSSSGPINGATTANGRRVRARNSETWPRASPVGIWKNSVPASEIATAASAAASRAPSSISRFSPLVSAPSAAAARRAERKANRLKRPVPRATEARPRPVTFAPDAMESMAVRRSESPGMLMSPSCMVRPTLRQGSDTSRGMGHHGAMTPKADAVAAAAADTAREALLLEVDPADVGEHLAAEADGDRVVTHFFDCRKPGYVGWRWS